MPLCLECGASFERPSKGYQLYCNIKCNKKAYYKRSVAGIKATLACFDCGKIQHASETGGRPRKRCPECVKIYRVKYMQELHPRYKAQRFGHLKAMTDRIKSSTPCTDCKRNFDPICMDFDHLPQHKKSFGVAKMISSIGFSEKRILEEIAKCEVVCANCHRLRTKQRREETVT